MGTVHQMSEAGGQRVVFHLYVVGENVFAPRTIKGVEDALAGMLGDRPYELKVFDVQRDPRSAFEGRIKATPTLVRVHPEPEIRIIGDVYDLNAFQSLLRDIR